MGVTEATFYIYSPVTSTLGLILPTLEGSIHPLGPYFVQSVGAAEAVSLAIGHNPGRVATPTQDTSILALILPTLEGWQAESTLPGVNSTTQQDHKPSNVPMKPTSGRCERMLGWFYQKVCKKGRNSHNKLSCVTILKSFFAPLITSTWVWLAIGQQCRRGLTTTSTSRIHRCCPTPHSQILFLCPSCTPLAFSHTHHYPLPSFVRVCLFSLSTLPLVFPHSPPVGRFVVVASWSVLCCTSSKSLTTCFKNTGVWIRQLATKKPWHLPESGGVFPPTLLVPINCSSSFVW